MDMPITPSLQPEGAPPYLPSSPSTPEVRHV